MKIINGESESWFSYRFQVVTYLRFQCAEFKIDKHRFKKPP